MQTKRKKWNDEEDNYLITNYSNGKKDEMIKKLNRSWVSIQSRASRFNIKKINVEIKGLDVKIWSNEEINFLKENYRSLDKEQLIKHLNRTWSSIQNKAHLLSIEREANGCEIKNLINKTNEAYYWLGFIMADGHFSKTNRIQINLSTKDLEHLKLFAKFISFKKELIKPSIDVGFNSIKNYLIDEFGITNEKTHYPCNLTKLSGDSFFSFIIGFIDGDGSINNKGYLSIVSHKNWLENIRSMLNEISYGRHYGCKISKNGLVRGYITNIETMKAIKQKAIELKLPILERKWDRVKETKLSKKERSLKNMNECLELFSKGLSVKQIIDVTKLSRSQVYKQKKIY